MSFAICMVPVCPVRAQPSHKSEQTSQLLFGERCELLEHLEDFVRIRVLYDNYDGWCHFLQLEETEIYSANNNKLAAEWVNYIKIDEQIMNIPFGSSLEMLDDTTGFATKYRVKYYGSFISVAKNTFSADLIKKYASMFLNTPYLWGGRSVFGIDCSGFTQVVFKCMNIALPRDAYQQVAQGEVVNSLAEATCGDLAFFNNEAGKITHVGMLLDSKTIIHSSGKVRIDDINDFGVINAFTGKQTHNLNMIKRISNIH